MTITDLIPRRSLRNDLETRIQERSLLMFGPRRVGKSTLLELLVREPPFGWQAVRIDLEGIRQDPVSGMLNRMEVALRGANLIRPEIAGGVRLNEVTVGPVGLGVDRQESGPPWSRIEERLREALDKVSQKGLIIALDEVPWWLDEVERAEGSGAARAALAELRRLRQLGAFANRLRLILTGSVGLSGQAAAFGASAELNDLSLLRIDPLDIQEGAQLFEVECTARGRPCSPAAARAAFRLAGGLPHWIKELATRVGGEGVEDEAAIDQAAATLLTHDQRHLFKDEGSEHFRRRHPDRQAALIAMLESMSGADGGGSQEAAITAALAAEADLTRAQARECLYLLLDGYYLREETDGSLSWVNPLFRRWWNRYGGL